MKFRKFWKKAPKILLAGFMSLTTVFSNGVPIEAATYNLTEDYQADWYFFGSSKYGNGAILYLNGKQAFCIEPDKVSAVGPNDTIKPSDIGLTNKQMEDMALITWYGYRSKSKPSKTDYMMTQNLVWKYLGSGQRMGNSTYPDESSMTSWFNNVMNKVNHFRDKPSFHGKTITVDMGETTSISDTNKVLSGLHIKSVSGGKASISGNTLKVTPDGTKDTMTISFDRGLSLEQTKDTIVVRQGQSQAVSTLTGRDPYFSNVRINVNLTGSLKIAKQDEDGNYVPNTSFKLSKNSDMSAPLGTYTTGNDGTVTINDLDNGTWYVQETSVPNHLVLDNTIKSVNIKSNQTTTFTQTNNWVKGKIKLRKVDSKTNEQVAGAVYGVYNEQGKELERLVTTATGFVESGYLRFGNYTVKEIIAPEGFVLNPQVYSVTVSQNEQRIEVTGSDKPIEGYIQVLKRDAETGKTVVKANTTFSIFKSNNTYVTDITTNNDGIAKSDLLRYGGYYLVEKTAPDGYTHSDEKLVYNITEDGKTYEAVLSNTRVKGQINLSKEDSVTGKEPQGEATLEGAVYEVRARENILDPADGSVIFEKDTLIKTLTTDKQGNASTDNQLYLGKYNVKEIKPSNGYTLDTKTYEVDLTYENQNVALVTKSVTSLERVASQAFSIIKISSDETGEADLLEGAEFTIKAQKDIDKYGSWEKAPIAKNAKGETASIMVTDKRGYAVSDELPYGKYVVRETKAPTDKYPVADFVVVVDEDSREPQPYRIFNDKSFESILKIVKKDIDTDKTVAVAGAEFKIKNTDTGEYFGYWNWNIFEGFYTDSWTTNEDGYIMTGEPLKAGNYQLEEIASPNGYLISDKPIPFSITSGTAYETLPDGETPVITVNAHDKAVKGKINIEKLGNVLVGFENGNFVYEERSLKGMKANIYAKADILDPSNDGTVIYKKGTLVDTIITGADGKATSKELYLGLYEVREITAPDGMVINNTPYTVELKYKDQNTPIVYENVTFKNERQKVKASVVKVDEDGTTGLSGAEFELTAKEDILNADNKIIVKAGTVLNTYTSDKDGNIVIDLDLPLDTDFALKETKAPEGYVLDQTEVLFNTDYQGQDIPTIVIEKTKENERTKVNFSKTDITTGKELAGNHMMIFEKENPSNIFTTWVSEDKPHLVENLSTNLRYILRETSSVKGFYLAQDIEFEIGTDGTVYVFDENGNKVEAKDNLIKMENDLVTGKLKWNKSGEIFMQTDLGQTEFGTVHSPIWQTSNLLGAEITIYAGEDITLGNGITYYEKDEKIQTLESDLEAVNSKELLVGKYYYVETKVPHGYVADNEKHYFEIKDNQSSEIQVVNSTLNNKRPTIDIDMTKVLEEQDVFKNPDAYKDVVFGIYAREDIYNYKGSVAIPYDTLVYTSGINEDGHLTLADTFDLPNGVYYLKELSTNGQYILDDTEYDFEIAYHGQDVSKYTVQIGDDGVINNKLARGTVQVKKVDTLDKELILKDVEFNISADKDMSNVITTSKTNDDGIAVFDNLELGKYYIQEAKQLDGYILNDTIYEVEVVANGDLLTIECENTPTSTIIEKVDEQGNKLSGAKLQVLDEKGHVIDEFISSDEAYELKYLVEGKEYTLHEQNAPYSYSLAEDIKFTAKDGQVITMVDEKVLTDIQVNKVDSVTKEAIKHKDFEFTIYADEECTQVIRTVSADKENGTATFKDMPYGTYYVKETKAPKGYQLSKEVKKVVLDDKTEGIGKVHSFVYENVLLPSKTVSTGYTPNIMMYFMLGGSSILGALYVLSRKRRNEE